MCCIHSRHMEATNPCKGMPALSFICFRHLGESPVESSECYFQGSGRVCVFLKHIYRMDRRGRLPFGRLVAWLPDDGMILGLPLWVPWARKESRGEGSVLDLSLAFPGTGYLHRKKC